MKFLEL